MINAGRATFQQLGYCIAGGEIMAWRIRRHDRLTKLLQDARAERKALGEQ